MLAAHLTQDLEHARLKAERQGQLLVGAEMARAAVAEEKRRLEAAFARSDRGSQLLRATRLKLELGQAREQLASCQARLAEQARIMPGLLLCMRRPWSSGSFIDWLTGSFLWTSWQHLSCGEARAGGQGGGQRGGGAGAAGEGGAAARGRARRGRARGASRAHHNKGCAARRGAALPGGRGPRAHRRAAGALQLEPACDLFGHPTASLIISAGTFQHAVPSRCPRPAQALHAEDSAHAIKAQQEAAVQALAAERDAHAQRAAELEGTIAALQGSLAEQAAAAQQAGQQQGAEIAALEARISELTAAKQELEARQAKDSAKVLEQAAQLGAANSGLAERLEAQAAATAELQARLATEEADKQALLDFVQVPESGT